MTTNIRIMLVEDSPAFREVIEHTFKTDKNLNITSQFASAEGALRSLHDLSNRKVPDLILLDLNLPGMSGIEALPWFKKELPDIKIIVLTQSGCEADVLAAIQVGADGYMLKNAQLNKLKEAIQNVVDGGGTIDPGVAPYILNSMQQQPSNHSEQEIPLSPRE